MRQQQNNRVTTFYVGLATKFLLLAYYYLEEVTLQGMADYFSLRSIELLITEQLDLLPVGFHVIYLYKLTI